MPGNSPRQTRYDQQQDSNPNQYSKRGDVGDRKAGREARRVAPFCPGSNSNSGCAGCDCEGDECALITDFDDATNKVIADGFSLATKGLGRREKISVNVGYDNILSGYVLALPPERTILEVPSDIQADARPDEVAEQVRQAISAKGWA